MEMRKGQVLTVCLLVFAFLVLYSAVFVQEALFALAETSALQKGLQARLFAQSGLVLAKETLREGFIPSEPLVLTVSEKEALTLNFRPNLSRSTVQVKATAEVWGRRFTQTQTFTFPFFLGQFALGIWNVEPVTGQPLPPTTVSLKGISFGSFVFLWEGQNEREKPIPSFMGIEKKSLFGVREDGKLVFPSEQPSLPFGLLTFEAWQQVPLLPGPFVLSVPFVPLVPNKETVTDGQREFRRVLTLPRFPKQYFLDEEKGLFFFSEHDTGRFVLLRFWHYGFRFFGSLYANAFVLFGKGTNLLVLSARSKEMIMATGKVMVEEQGRVWQVTANGVTPLSFDKGVKDSVLEGVSPLPCPLSPFSAWRMDADPTLGGEGEVLPEGSVLDLNDVSGDVVFFSGNGQVHGFVPENKGLVTVVCDGTMALLGSVGAKEGSHLVLVARHFRWQLREKEPAQLLFAFLWATKKGLEISPPSFVPSPIRCLLVGSFNLNEPPDFNDPEFRFGVEVFGVKMPFLSSLVQPIQGGGAF